MQWNREPAMRFVLRLTCAAAALTATAAIAHEGATGVVKVRMDAMSAIADDMKLIGRGLRSGTLDAAAGAEAASRIAGHAADIPEQFREPNTDHPSEALPVIWDEFERFSEIAGELETHAAAFVVEAGAGADNGGLNAAFRQMGATCSACHEDFRLKQ